MKTIREHFEEIWPVPHGIGWNSDHGRYMVLGRSSLSSGIAAVEYQARLDTFTRCQETTAIYSGIVDDMIREMELINSVSKDLRAVGIAREAIGRAKQKMGMMK